MSFKHITELRKTGDLEAAYQEAKADLTTDGDNIWSRRAMAWVLYDKIKGMNSCESNEQLSLFLDELSSLELSSEENMFWDNFLWVLAQRISKATDNSAEVCSTIFQFLTSHTFLPSDGYSHLFSVFHRHRSQWNGYLDFCDWWNFDNFQPNDFVKVKYGKQDIMSLVEQAYIGYAKQLLALKDRARIEAFIPRLKMLIESHPEYVYPLYFISKLLLTLGRNKEAFELLLPFVRKKQNDYWVWQILGDAADTTDVTFSCYSKALTCFCKDEMLVGIKEHYAEMLVKRQYYNEARTEIEQVIKVRAAHQWCLSAFLSHQHNQDWYQNATVNKTNLPFYKKHLGMAEELLFADLKITNILIIGINAQKRIANFITNSLANGFFHYGKYLRKTPQLGDTFEVRFSDLNKDGASHIASICKSMDVELWTSLTKNFNSTIRINEERRFGIVFEGREQIFIPRQLLGPFTTGDSVEGTAVKSYDKKRNCFGWSAFCIQKVEKEKQ